VPTLLVNVKCLSYPNKAKYERSEQRVSSGGSGCHTSRTSSSRRTAAIVGRSTVGQSTVEQDCTGAIDIRNSRETLVQRIVIAIANNLVHKSGIGVVVASTHAVLLAEAVDGLTLVLARALVVEVVRVIVVVLVCTV